MYQLLDSGCERKLEKFGDFIVARPSAQAIWTPQLNEAEWKRADLSFDREKGWNIAKGVPKSWVCSIAGVTFKIEPTDFGHLGIFPEHQEHWSFLQKETHIGDQVLNLFAYTGGATLFLAKAGIQVCHLDASKKSVAWAKENAQLSLLQDAKVRWIIDDAMKFVCREVRREVRYKGVILDPPTYGRGAQGQIFKIETDLLPLLVEIKKLKPAFIVLTCHTPGITPTVLSHLLKEVMGSPAHDAGEMLLGELPSGNFARWTCGI